MGFWSKVKCICCYMLYVSRSVFSPLNFICQPIVKSNYPASHATMHFERKNCIKTTCSIRGAAPLPFIHHWLARALLRAPTTRNDSSVHEFSSTACSQTPTILSHNAWSLKVMAAKDEDYHAFLRSRGVKEETINSMVEEKVRMSDIPACISLCLNAIIYSWRRSCQGYKATVLLGK